MKKKEDKQNVKWENSSVPDFETHCESLWQMLASPKAKNKMQAKI